MKRIIGSFSRDRDHWLVIKLIDKSLNPTLHFFHLCCQNQSLQAVEIQHFWAALSTQHEKGAKENQRNFKF